MKPLDLKKWRDANNYSQSQLARVLGVSALTISRWERGESEIPPFLRITLTCVKKQREKPQVGRPFMKGGETMDRYSVEYGNGLNVQEKEFSTKESADDFADRIRQKYEFVKVFAPGCKVAYLKL